MLRVAAALEEAGWSVWVDREDVPPASEWREELALGIRTAHTFVFVLSKSSVESDYCRWELEEAVRLGKRLIPVVIDDVESAPEQLASRQYVFMRPEDDFEQAVTTLTTAVATDLDWVREHRHWLLEALRWEAHDRDRSLLVRGRDLKRAQAWFSRQGANLEPRPTELQARYLLASRAWETRRTQVVAGAVAVALAVTVVLGIAALLQRNEARDQAATARSRELAIAADSQVGIDPQRALLLAREAVLTKATAEADNSLRRATQANRLLAEIPVRAKRIGALVNDVAFSPDGTRVAAAVKAGTISVAGVGGGRRDPLVLPAGRRRTGDVCSNSAGTEQQYVSFSPDGTRIAAADAFGRISVWRRPGPHAPVTSPFCLGRAEPPLATDLLGVLTKGATVAPAALAFSSDDVVQFVQPDGDLVRWRWVSESKPTAQRVGRGPVVTAAFSGDGSVVAVARASGVNVAHRGSSTRRTLPLRDVYALALNADGTAVAAVTGRSVAVWRPAESSRTQTLTSPSTIRSVALDRGGDALAIGDGRNAIRVWDLAGGAGPIVLAGAGGAVTAVAFSPDGGRIVGGSDDGIVRVWAWEAGRPEPARVTSDGRLLARDVQDATRGWILAGGERRRVEGLPESVDDVSVSRDGRRAAVAAAAVLSRDVLLWDTAAGSRPRRITFARGVNGVAVSPDGQSVAVAEGRTFRVVPWATIDGGVLASSGDVQYTTPTFSPDGRRVAIAAFTGRSSTVLVWGLGSGRTPVGRFSALGHMNDIDFSEDGEQVVAAGSDGAVRVWELEAESPAVALRGHEGPANGVGISPDGTEVVSGGSDGTVRVWELETAKAVTFAGPGGPIVDVAFTADGSEIVASSTEGTRVFSCGFCGPTSDVLERAARMATRDLTAAERALFLHER